MSKRNRIKTEVFNGMTPIIADTLLKAGLATVAENVDLRSGNLEPFKGSVIEEAAIASATKTIFKYRQHADSTAEWLTFTDKVDIVTSPINADTYERIFYSGHTDGKLHQKGTFGDQPVYVPTPDGKMTATIVDQFPSDDVTCKMIITSDYLDNLGNTNQDVTEVVCPRNDSVSEEVVGLESGWSGWHDSDGFGNTGGGNFSIGFTFPETIVTLHPLESGATSATNTVTTEPQYTIDGAIFDNATVGQEIPLEDDDSFEYGSYKVTFITTDEPVQYTGLTTIKLFSMDISLRMAITSIFPAKFRYYYFCTFVNNLGQEGPAVDILNTPEVTRDTIGDLSKLGKMVSYDGEKDVAPPWFRDNPTGSEDGYTSLSGPFIRDLTDKLTLTDLPTTALYNVTKRRIYRNLLNYGSTGNAKFSLIAEQDIAETEFVDWDEGNGMVYDERTNPKDDLLGLVAHPNRFLVGFKEDTVYVSDINLPNTWKKYYTIDAPVVGLAINGKDIVVLTTASPTLLSGSNPFALSMSKIAHEQSCSSKDSICKIGNVVAYASPDGLNFISGGVGRLATEDFIHPDQWLAFSPETMVATQYDGQIYITSDTGTYVFNPREGANSFTTLSESISIAYNDLFDDELYYVRQNTGVYDIMNFNEDEADPYEIKWKSKKFDYKIPTVFTKCRVIADDYTTNPISLLIYVDGSLEYTMSITGDRVHNFPFRRNEKYWAFEVQSKTNIRRVEVGQSTGDFI